MTTLFDVGDEIEVTLKGKIINYSVSESGDCYTIVLKNNGDFASINEVRVYLDSSALENAVKI